MSRQPTAPIDPVASIDASDEPMRSPSLMPIPAAGQRRYDHPDPRGLPPPEVKVARAWRVSCDGGEGALGHPRVWLSIPHDQGFIDCGYCDARFVHQDFADGENRGGDPEGHRGVGHPGNPADHTQPADDAKGDVGGKQAGTQTGPRTGGGPSG